MGGRALRWLVWVGVVLVLSAGAPGWAASQVDASGRPVVGSVAIQAEERGMAGPGGIIWMPVVKNGALVTAVELLQRGDYWKAAGAFNAVLKQNPNDWEALLGAASVEATQTHWVKAMRMLRDPRKFRYPQNPVLLATLAWWLHEYHLYPPCKGDAEGIEGREMIDDLLTMAKAYGDSHPTVLLVEANLQLERGQMDAAAKTLAKLAEVVGTPWVPMLQAQARLALQMKDVQKARNLLMLALELSPNDPITFFYMGKLLAQVDSPLKAMNFLAQSQKLWPGPFPPRELLMAQLYQLMGRQEDALKRLEAMGDLAACDPDVARAMMTQYVAMGRHWPEKRFGPAPKLISDEQGQSLLALAQEQLRNEQFEAALEHLNTLMAGASSLPLADQITLYQWVTQAYYARSFFGVPFDSAALGAQAKIEQWIRTEIGAVGHEQLPTGLKLMRLKWELIRQGVHTPYSQEQMARLESIVGDGSPEAQVDVGEALFLLGRYDESRLKLELYEPDTPEKLMATADRLLLLQELVSAQALYERALAWFESPQGQQDCQQGLGMIQKKRSLADRRIAEGDAYFAGKDFLMAEKRYQMAVRIDAQSARAQLRLGELYERLKKPAMAFTFYERALRLQPTLRESRQFMHRFTPLRKTYGPKEVAGASGGVGR